MQATLFNQQSLVKIYDEYHTPIYRYVSRQGGDGETARDLTADVFQKLVRVIERRTPIEQISAWLYRTAHNTVIDHYRRQKFRQHLPLDESLVDTDDDPVAAAERNINAAQVRAALSALTPEQQEVISLKFLQGLSNQETAEIMNKPVTAVKALQRRALGGLQRQLARTGGVSR